jgi:NAD+ kinase
MRVAIVCKPKKEELTRILPELIGWLRQRNYDPVLDSIGGGYTDAAPAVDYTELSAMNPSLVIVLGGDGTLLAAARAFSATGTPLLSVNLGYLGFLTEIRLSDLYATLEGWCSNCHKLDARALLGVELWREGALHASWEALNEAVVSRGETAHMGDFAVELDGLFVAGFRADGVIISTPTGSTAYSLAANGPILTPDVDALVVTPVCPHLLTLRPIVVRGDAALTIRNNTVAGPAQLTVDGQAAIALRPGDEVRCQRSGHTVNLVRLSESGFFEALRNKLSWGQM